MGAYTTTFIPPWATLYWGIYHHFQSPVGARPLSGHIPPLSIPFGRTPSIGAYTTTFIFLHESHTCWLPGGQGAGPAAVYLQLKQSSRFGFWSAPGHIPPPLSLVAFSYRKAIRIMAGNWLRRCFDGQMTATRNLTRLSGYGSGATDYAFTA